MHFSTSSFLILYATPDTGEFFEYFVMVTVLPEFYATMVVEP